MEFSDNSFRIVPPLLLLLLLLLRNLQDRYPL
jgi:hypothetical protein